MKVITIDSEVWKALVRKIDRIYNHIEEQAKKDVALSSPDPSKIWIGNEEAAELLCMSKRTLQRLRSGREITYSIRAGRTWYTLDEIHRVMTGRVVSSKYRLETDLLTAHREYQERRKAGGAKKRNQ